MNLPELGDLIVKTKIRKSVFVVQAWLSIFTALTIIGFIKELHAHHFREDAVITIAEIVFDVIAAINLIVLLTVARNGAPYDGTLFDVVIFGKRLNQTERTIFAILGGVFIAIYVYFVRLMVSYVFFS